MWGLLCHFCPRATVMTLRGFLCVNIPSRTQDLAFLFDFYQWKTLTACFKVGLWCRSCNRIIFCNSGRLDSSWCACLLRRDWLCVIVRLPGSWLLHGCQLIDLGSIIDDQLFLCVQSSVRAFSKKISLLQRFLSHLLYIKLNISSCVFTWQRLSKRERKINLIR